MSSKINTMYHVYIFLCLECKDLFKFSTLDLALQLLSKVMYEVKRFYEFFLLVRNNPNFREPPQRILKQLPENNFQMEVMPLVMFNL